MAADIKRHRPRYNRRMRTRYTKENDGNTRRQQIRTHTGRAVASFCVMCISLGALVRLTRTNQYNTVYDGASHHHQYLDNNDYEHKRAKLMTERYRYNGGKSHFDHEESYHRKHIAKKDDEKINLILSGKVHLVGLKIDQHDLQSGSGYKGVLGEFCSLDWSRYKGDPSSTPMFKDLVSHSCTPGNTFTYDLKKVVNLATTMDIPDVHAIEPSGFIFHESRCGSTLVANALVAMDPEQHRVYSESRPPIRALKACGVGGKECPPHVAAELFQDVIYVMGRTRDPRENKLFFKIQSSGTKYIDVAMEAFPRTPWIFVYRDPVHIMTSQLTHGVTRANCVKHLDLTEVKHEFLVSIGRSLKNLRPEEKCAIHLSMLCDAAIIAIGQSDGMGIGVNYENLVDKLIDKIIPQHFNVAITEERRERILDVSGNYSKGRGHKAKEWKEDSLEKDRKATPEVREASKIFLYESYKILENI